jgi:HEAT repeat protein
VGPLFGHEGPLVRIGVGDAQDFIRREAIRLLRTAGQGHPGVLEAARRRLKDPSRDVRVQCARLLGGYLDKKSIGPLLKAMADPHWSVRESAELALLNFGRDALDPLIEALRNPSWTMRFRAARLLGETGDPRAVPALKTALERRKERKDVRKVAQASLAKLENASSS